MAIRSDRNDAELDDARSTPVKELPNPEYVWRAFRIDHSSAAVKVIGDFDLRDDAMEAEYLDQCDEPAPDKGLFHFWGICCVYRRLSQGPAKRDNLPADPSEVM